jgi:hypothetical protein
LHISERKYPLRKTLSILVSAKRGVIFWDGKRMYVRSSHCLSLDSYVVESEDFLLTFFKYTTKISPPLVGGDEGEGEAEGFLFCPPPPSPSPIRKGEGNRARNFK